MERRSEALLTPRDNLSPLYSGGPRHSAAHQNATGGYSDRDRARQSAGLHNTTGSLRKSQTTRPHPTAQRDTATFNGTRTSHGSPNSSRTQRQTQASQEPGPSPSLPAGQERNRGIESQASWPLGNSTKWNSQRDSQQSSVDYDAPDNFLFLDEVADSGPVRNPDEQAYTQYQTLEDTRKDEKTAAPADPEGQEDAAQGSRVSRWTTQLYTISYLILFSFFGTLARLGLQTLTNYPGAPVFPSVWFNFGGSLVMGFLAEDRMLFRNEWGTPIYDREIRRARGKQDSEESGSDAVVVDLAAAKKAHQATKKTIPLYIGLATGFCGSFTSFSSFIRDIFLALSNDLAQPGVTTTVPRNGGYSFMALMAVIIITVTASLSGLFIGAHIAIASESVTPSLPYRFSRKVMDRLGVFLGWGCWAGAVVLVVIPPHNYWRGEALFALVFAPVGTLTRFYASLWLNRWNPSFPLGTFTVNVFGTAVLGLAWDLQRVPLGGAIGCQALQGVEDGFCGCLTTVSTWVSELAALRRKHAWTYGTVSILVSFGVMVLVMGGLRWTQGFAVLQCVH